jgi:hypothetical protein
VVVLLVIAAEAERGATLLSDGSAWRSGGGLAPSQVDERWSHPSCMLSLYVLGGASASG